MKSFLLVFVSVSISLSVAWFWHQGVQLDKPVSTSVPNTVYGIYREAKFDDQFVRFDGYLKPFNSELALYQNKESAYFKGPLPELSLVVLLPIESVPEQCIDSYIRVLGRAKYTAYGFGIDNLRLFWSLDHGISCLADEYYDRNLKDPLVRQFEQAKRL